MARRPRRRTDPAPAVQPDGPVSAPSEPAAGSAGSPPPPPAAGTADPDRAGVALSDAGSGPPGPAGTAPFDVKPAEDALSVAGAADVNHGAAWPDAGFAAADTGSAGAGPEPAVAALSAVDSLDGPAGLALAHLQCRLLPLHHRLRGAVDEQTERNQRLSRPDLVPFCVSGEEIALLLDRTAAVLEPDGRPDRPDPAPEPAVERALRRRAAAIGAVLPLDALARRFRLGPAELDVLALIAAPELDAGWSRTYAYIVDDLNRRLPSVELLLAVLGHSPADRVALRRLLGPAGPLRRYGLLRPAAAAPVGLGEELVLGPGVADFLLAGAGTADLLGADPGEVLAPAGFRPPPQLPEAALRRLAAAVNSGQLDLIGLWGGPAPVQRDAVLALAAHAGRPVRRFTAPDGDPDQLRTEARVAAELNALLWVPAEQLAGPALDLLAGCRLPAVLTGTAAYRPTALLAARAYAELDVPVPDYAQRRAMWSAALPALGTGAVTDLAARYRMSGEELRAVAAVADAGARFAGNGRPAPLADQIAPAVATVTRGRSSGHARSVTPRRTPADLVLPPEQYRHVLEIGAAFRTWPRVAEAWGFRRRAGDAGVKVLFTGEPGTGKTLSAEVLAGMLGLELLCIDLSQLVSKWVGETEKNLEEAFRQAEDSQAVLFFDEADALFGKRGDVKHGTDRYANLEVGYLLQRLENSDALVVLASNLKENIDPAFTRRFHFAVHFARPGLPERRRLWQLAFPAEAPVESDVDFEALSRLDMTGAGIVGAARSAALAAADSAGAAITMRDVVRGVARQYQREARLLRSSDLGPHGAFLADPAAPAEPARRPGR